MKRDLQIPPQLRRRPFTRQEAEAAGVLRGAFESGHLRKIFHGVYRAQELAPTDVVRSWAALLAVRGPGAIGGATALRLHGVEMPLGYPAANEMLVVRDHRASHRGAQGISIHATRLPIIASPWRTRPEMLVASPVSAWLQVAERGASIYELIVIGDGLVRRRDPLSSIEELRAAVEGATEVDGLAALRQALEFIRPGTDSSMETHQRLVIVAAGLPEPEVSVEVPVPGRRKPYHLDQGYRRWRVGLEYEGSDHADLKQWRIDQDRLSQITDQAWEVLRSNATIIADPRPFLRRLERALRRHGWDGERIVPRLTPDAIGLPGGPIERAA